VLLGASLVYSVNGQKEGRAFAWCPLITGEMLFVAFGLGQQLVAGRNLNDSNHVVAVMILIAALGYIVGSILLRKLETSLRDKWGRQLALQNNREFPHVSESADAP
jgi:NitT/TauT family transport system permease protein